MNNLELPPSYIDGSSIATWLTDVFNSPYGLPCVCADQTVGNQIYAVRPHITRICQRQDNPCIVEISFHLGTANGLYNYDPNTSGFSLDTTDGHDGTWHQLRTDEGDAGHNPSLNNLTLAGTDTVDGSWAYGLYNPNSPGQNGLDPCEPDYTTLGIPVHTFVFDMCEHVSSWLSEPSVSFRLSFNKTNLDIAQPSACRNS